MKRSILTILLSFTLLFTSCSSYNEADTVPPDATQNETTQNTKALPKELDREATFAACTEEQILQAAVKYYTKDDDSFIPLAELDSVDGDTWMIHLYEDLDDHVATSNWYTIDRKTLQGTDILDEPVDLADTLITYFDVEPIYK